MDYKDYQVGQTNANFWFKGKNNLIDILMSKVSQKEGELKILNLGVGTGDDLKILNKYGNNYLIDINRDALDLIESNLYFEKKVANACAIPYDNNFFDVVISLDVFEHIANDDKSVSEIYRVLKKGGLLVFSVPAFQFLFSGHDIALDHKRRYGKQALRRLLVRFEGLKLCYWNTTMFFPIAASRLIKLNSKPEVDHVNFHKAINNLLYFFLSMENMCIKYNVPLPFGISLVGFCRK